MGPAPGGLEPVGQHFSHTPAETTGGAGFKAYFTERAFFRTDLKLSARDGVEQLVWKVGVGIDF